MRWSTEPNHTFYEIEEYEAPWNTGAKLEGGSRGHRPTVRGGYFPVPPVDSTQDMRAEMVLILESLGMALWKCSTTKWRALAKNEIGTRSARWSSALTGPCCKKYVIHNVANAYGKTATFHAQAHTTATTAPACTCTSPCGRTARTCSLATATPACPDFALYYIGGIIGTPVPERHHQPGTNSYKRLVPHFEAPVKLAYSAKNRSLRSAFLTANPRAAAWKPASRIH